MQARVESINAILEQEPTPSSESGPSNIARLVTEGCCLPVTFFCDGLKLADHAFLSYGLRPAQDIIKDILDTKLPRNLSEERPQGMSLRVVDRTGSTFAVWL